MLNYIREYRDKDGSLFPLDIKDIPFEVKRIFFITGTPKDTTRGKHAHKKCEQVLLCLRGVIKVNLENKHYHIEQYLTPGEVVHMQTKTWGEQTYLTHDAVLAVFCSEEYNQNDYITNKDEIYED